MAGIKRKVILPSGTTSRQAIASINQRIRHLRMDKGNKTRIRKLQEKRRRIRAGHYKYGN